MKKPTDRVAINVWLPRKLRMDFKHKSELEGMNMNENIIDLIQRWLKFKKGEK